MSPTPAIGQVGVRTSGTPARSSKLPSPPAVGSPPPQPAIAAPASSASSAVIVPSARRAGVGRTACRRAPRQRRSDRPLSPGQYETINPYGTLTFDIPQRRHGEPMTLPGETIASGAAPRCEDCGVMAKLDVYRSAAPGYYIGTYCDCGPYTRESGTTVPASSPKPTSTAVLQPLTSCAAKPPRLGRPARLARAARGQARRRPMVKIAARFAIGRLKRWGAERPFPYGRGAATRVVASTRPRRTGAKSQHGGRAISGGQSNA
jgi:hypothetical protein